MLIWEVYWATSMDIWAPTHQLEGSDISGLCSTGHRIVIIDSTSDVFAPCVVSYVCLPPTHINITSNCSNPYPIVSLSSQMYSTT